MSQTEVRSAHRDDKEVVLAFCANTWDWGDYIERVWDEWLVDPQGKLFVAVTDGQATGLAHLRMVTPTDAWLEGLRVDPQYRQQGIATALNMAMLEEATRRDATNARLVTESTNTGALRIMDTIQMRHVGSFVPFRATPTPVQQHSRARVEYQPEATQLATVEHVDEIIDYLNASSVFPAVGGLYYLGFVAYEITAAFLEQHIAAQHVYLLRRWERLDGLAIAEPREEHQGRRLSVGYIDGMTIEAISLVAHNLRSRLTDMNLARIYVYAPDLVLVRDGLSGIGYEWDGKIFHTYERGLV